MISVDEALQKVVDQVKPITGSHTIQLKDGLHTVLAEDILSPIDMPPFRQSAMDGYAIHLQTSPHYKLVGEVKAGDEKNPSLNPGDAVRIFTGAPVPDDANAVAIQEKVKSESQKISLESRVDPGANIRPKGEQVQKGMIALEKGTKLSPAAIGFLQSLGVTGAKVYTKPKIALVTTGSELIEAGSELTYGKIYDSNSIMMTSVLEQMGFKEITVKKTEDDYHKTMALLDSVINQHDLVLISGGISVGDYDYVGKALDQLNVEQVFYKVNQKPGKPLYFGMKNNSYVFALPGNPASALTGFYIYVLPALELMRGNRYYHPVRTRAQIKNDFTKKGSRAQFLKALVINNEVEIMDGQSSSMLKSYSLANALAYVPADKLKIRKGDWIDIIPITT